MWLLDSGLKKSRKAGHTAQMVQAYDGSHYGPLMQKRSIRRRQDCYSATIFSHLKLYNATTVCYSVLQLTVSSSWSCWDTNLGGCFSGGKRPRAVMKGVDVEQSDNFLMSHMFWCSNRRHIQLNVIILLLKPWRMVHEGYHLQLDNWSQMNSFHLKVLTVVRTLISGFSQTITKSILMFQTCYNI